LAVEFAISEKSVSRIRHDPTVRADVYVSSSARLGLADREEISRGLAAGWSLRRIASGLRRAPSTVSREIRRNGGRDAYRAARAQVGTCQRARRPKPSVFQRNRCLAAVVERWLEFEQWSPVQISARLASEFPDDETMRVSAETIYQALYVYGRGGLRKELAQHLRSQRTSRRAHTVTARNRGRSPIPDLVSIAERPDEVDQRLVPGHWEGDLIMGSTNRSAIGTLVERATRYVILLHLPGRHGAVEVRNAMAAAIQNLPATLRRSITWDQGVEMTEHKQFTIDTGVDIYFCDPHSPWQRGSNENTNGLLRQYFPKGLDLSRFDTHALQAAADSLNGRPRQTLNWRTPTEALTRFLATTD
jgi:IS30 family transposase